MDFPKVLLFGRGGGGGGGNVSITMYPLIELKTILLRLTDIRLLG